MTNAISKGDRVKAISGEFHGAVGEVLSASRSKLVVEFCVDRSARVYRMTTVSRNEVRAH